MKGLDFLKNNITYKYQRGYIKESVVLTQNTS